MAAEIQQREPTERASKKERPMAHQDQTGGKGNVGYISMKDDNPEK
jgi:hypothetical protein